MLSYLAAGVNHNLVGRALKADRARRIPRRRARQGFFVGLLARLPELPYGAGVGLMTMGRLLACQAPSGRLGGQSHEHNILEFLSFLLGLDTLDWPSGQACAARSAVTQTFGVSKTPKVFIQQESFTLLAGVGTSRPYAAGFVNTCTARKCRCSAGAESRILV